jgi:SAM-dependent methyltransferase
MKTANDFFIEAEISRWVSTWPEGAHRVLDLGCGESPHLPTLSSRGAQVVSADLERRGLATQLLADAARLPFPDGVFDKVLLSEVLEHIPLQGAVIKELARVTRVGGSVFLTTPLHYSIHELPHDYFRPTEYGLRWLFESAGCTVVRVQRRGGAVCVLTTMSLQLAHGFMQAPGRLGSLGALYSRTITPVVSGICEAISYLSFFLSYRRGRSAKPLEQMRGVGKALSLWTNGYCVEAIRGSES